MPHEVTITISDEVYQGLQTIAGKRSVGEFLVELARPLIAESFLEAAYLDMALDSEREREATEWSEGLVYDSSAGAPDAAR
jgi:predicted CopG family antitoxin